MPSAADEMINKALQKLQEQEAEVIKTKQFINQVCAFEGSEPRFTDADLIPDTAGGGITIKRAEFYKKPLATAVRTYLEKRQQADLGPATLDEIFSALTDGGFNFPAKGDEKQKASVQISLTKNTTTFERLPDNTYALAIWYAGRRRKKHNQSIAADDGDNELPQQKVADEEGADDDAPPVNDGNEMEDRE